MNNFVGLYRSGRTIRGLDAKVHPFLTIVIIQPENSSPPEEPFQRNGGLIGREKYIQSLERKPCVDCCVALVGLGGIIEYVAWPNIFSHTRITFILILLRKT